MKDKLLFMGASSDTFCALEHCRKMGVYTIVTDYLPYEKSKAKQLADEYWMIDLKDTDTLEKKCREEKITGVYAGNNEFCLDQTRLLAKRLGMPFYASDVAWKATRDKLAFKEHCLAVGLDAPKLYKLKKPFDPEQLRQIQYPVIVKPTDACASLGLTRCDNEEELIKAWDFALQYSASSEVVVEEYVQGLEIAPAHFIVNGKVQFTSFDTILYGNRENGNNMLVTIFPSKLQEEYLRQCKDKVQALCDRLGSPFGNFYFEVIYANNKFYFLELIHRVDGVGIWSLTQRMQGFNVIKRMVNYALGYPEPPLEEPEKDANVGGVYFYWAKPGKIGKITGREEVKSMPGMELILDRYKVGDTIQSTGSMYGMAFYFSLVAKDREQFVERLKAITSVLKVFDEDGNELTEPDIPVEAIMNA